MDVLNFIQNLLGNSFGRVVAVCKDGSWLYTKDGKVKICVPRFEPLKEGQKVEKNLSLDLLEEEVLFVETDKGVLIKDGTDYRFFPKGTFKMVWKNLK